MEPAPALNRWQLSSAGTRLGVAGATGAVVGLLVWLVSGSPKGAGLGAWLGAAVVFLVWTFLCTWWMDSQSTAHLAQREDPSRAGSDAVLLVVAIATLLIVATVIFQASADEPHFVILGVVSIAASWLVVHTIFTLRYARIYYGDPVGGVDFNGDDQPDYRDFYYLGFTVGMTFQVSDTNVSSRAIRVAILRHALISFVFGTIIIAVTINVLAGLGGG